jgi:homoserine dehydrogenase
MTREIRMTLIGLGNVGRSFLRILETKHERIRKEYGLSFRLVGVADSSGVAVNPRGYDLAATLSAKESGLPVRRLAGYWPHMEPGDILAADFDCDLLLDASPVNLTTGQPGLGAVRMALRQGVNVVLANKAPLVLAFPELRRLAKESGAGLAYSATVCGALPVINIGRRDLIAAEIQSVRGIFNSTSNYMLDAMSDGQSYADALAEAQARGLAETDPSLDVEGWDTANKLVIIANSILGVEATLGDVAVEGITDVSAEDLHTARKGGQVIKLVATAERDGEGYVFRVAPTPLPEGEFLAQCRGWEMGIEFVSDLYGHMFFKDREGNPIPTAAAMLRDAVNLFA